MKKTTAARLLLTLCGTILLSAVGKPQSSAIVPSGSGSSGTQTTEAAGQPESEESAVQIGAKTSVVRYMKSQPNQTGTWIKGTKGYRFRLNSKRYLKNGWAKINGKIYYFDKNGYRKTGFFLYQKKKYYLKTNGQLAISSWVTRGSQRYYINTQGIVTTGLMKKNGNYYYFGETGAMVRGWKRINGKLYYFKTNGVRASGWVIIRDTKDQKRYRHYFSASGTPVTGWRVINGRQYYLSATGRVTTGWKTVRDYRYYFGADGVGVEGFKKLSGKWYYFSQGLMLTDQWVDGYYLGSDGVRQEDDKSKVRKTIFCGDSRTVLLSRAINHSEHLYVAKSMEGYLWFRSTGIGTLQRYLTRYPKSNVVLNFGVNDVLNVDKYIALYQKLFQMYPKARFYIMSVNPVEDDKYPAIAKRRKTTQHVETFNKKMKEAFPTRYIDTYSYLKKVGFETIDGVHYTEQTYNRIYNYTIGKL